MSSDQAASAAMIALMLFLPASALLARRLPLPNMVKLAAIWIAIFAIGAGIAVLLRG